MIIAEATEHDEQVARAGEMMDREDYSGAIAESSKVLEELQPGIATIAEAARTKARAMMTQSLSRMSTEGKLPDKQVLREIWKLYQLTSQLTPECEVTKGEMKQVSYLLKEIPPPKPPKMVADADFDVLVVGAGASGVGTALMLTKTFGLANDRVVLIERGADAGETFRRWPKEMRFISPSFNQQGWTESFDLNAIAKGTSPAYSLHSEHPSGNEYASYLSAICKTHKLNVRASTEVLSVEEAKVSQIHTLFNVRVKSLSNDGSDGGKTETLTARYIVWAAGEFQYPKGKSAATTERAETEEEKKHEDEETESPFETMSQDQCECDDQELPGSNLCIHNSRVRSWASVPGDDFIVIGGYESGVDAVVNLARAGKKSRMLASTPCWSVKTEDPSSELAPYTASRLREVLSPDTAYPAPRLYAPLRVVRIDRGAGGKGFDVTATWKEPDARPPHAPLRDLVQKAPMEPLGAAGSTLVLHTEHPPILCTGFEGSVRASAKHLFEFAGDDDDSDTETDTDDEIDEFELAMRGPHHHDHSHSHSHSHGHGHHKKGGCLAGAPLLTDRDESTKVPGVFLVGPAVVHKHLSFCFVYKFRQRFAIVASAICGGLGIDTRAAIAECRKANMYLDDFSCCGDTCGDVC